MKLRSLAPLIAFTAFLPFSAQAQLLTEWEIIKGIDYVQTSAADPVVKTGAPYFFETLFKVASGDAVTSATTPTTSIPSGSSASNQRHAFDSEDNEWGTATLAVSQGALDGLIGNGTFTTNITFDTAGTRSGSLDLSASGGVTFFANNPKITSLTNAWWSDGKLHVTAGTTATIGFNGTSVTGFGSEDVMFVDIENHGSVEQSTPFDSFTIGTGGSFDLVAGTYELEIEYVNYVDVHTNDFDGSKGEAGFLNNVLVELVVVSAVPEPSSYALLGGLTIFGVALRRRRRV